MNPNIPRPLPHRTAPPSPAPLLPDACTRRRFLRQAAAASAALTLIPRHVLGAPGTPAPNSRLQLAGVGVGGVGFSQLQACARAGFHIAALCDVDDAYAKKAYDRWPQARRYRDFRDLLQAEGDRIDALYCATPDHTHALITVAALRRKKHVCCVKPLTRTVHESRVVVAEAQKAGVATQVTAAANTSDTACRSCELIAAGAIGPVREVHIWSSRPLWPQGMQRPPGEDPVPASLDWKLWLGPAPARPYKKQWPQGHYALAQANLPGGKAPSYSAVYHPWNFRGWWDFGTGALGDMGCHWLNTPFRALQLDHPARIRATSTKVPPETAPLASIVTFDFPARASRPSVRVVWHDGGLQPPCPSEMDGQPLPEEGTLYVGDEGKMLGATLLSPARAKQFESLPRTLERRGGTWAEWHQACQGGPKAGCHFAWAGLLNETVLLGNIAIRTGKHLEWNAPRMAFTSPQDANAHLQPPYHNGWSLDSI
ncbi:MAG: Gfo/Idh/MocA family oxidoreductase [Verrucomicrobia bacterium]|nr:Gfo/Idh/MocA family oxidoreductase [Verrucomicrobiota bacterium]